MKFLFCTQPFSNVATVETIREIFEKIKLAVEYNGLAPSTKREATAIHKRLPNLSNALRKNHQQNGFVAYKFLINDEKTLNQQLQTDGISTENLKRFENFLYQLNNSIHSISVKESLNFFFTAENTFKYLLRAKQLNKIVNVIK